MGPELRGIQSPIFSEPIDFTFHEQTFTLLVGSSGSGKSSLFQIIAQVTSLPYSGQVLIDGSEVSQLSIVKRVQTVGILFQNPDVYKRQELYHSATILAEQFDDKVLENEKII